MHIATRCKESHLFRNIVILTLFVLLGMSVVTAFAAPAAKVRTAPVAAGAIAGRVIDDSEGAKGIAGARIEAFTCADERPSGSAVSDKNGEYLLAPIDNGCYFLRFDGEGFESSWYGDPPLKDTAVEVLVAGEKVSGIDAPISTSDSVISGRVKGPDGKALPGVWVTAFQMGDGGSISDARSDEKGVFSVKVSAGSYVLTFARRGYVARIYGKSLEDPSVVEAPAGGKADGIEVAMAKGGRITGTLTDEEGKALHGIYVLANAENQEILPVTARSDQGRFVLDGLPSGKYRIAFVDREERYYAQWHDGKSNPEEAILVEVKAPGTTAGIKGLLRQAGGISGRVTDESGNALAQVAVIAQSTGASQAIGNALTDASGEYTISGLPSGAYIVAFRTLSSMQPPRFYPNGAEVGAAIPVVVTAPQRTYGIDQILPGGVFATGKVKDTDGEPIPMAFLSVYPLGSDSQIVGFTTSAADGNFSISLPEGEYVLECSREGYLSQWSGGQSERSKAEPILLSRERPSQPLDIVLPRGGSLSGIVKNREGVGIAGITVSATNAESGEWGGSATSEESGTFLVQGLPSASYSLTATGSAAGYVRERLPQLLVVNAPATTENIEIVMKRGGTILGKVVDRNGKPMPGVSVAAHDPLTWDEIARTESEASGSYQIGGLSEGRYAIRFETPKYRVQWFKGSSRREEAVPVEVTGTATIAGIDATLDPGLLLTGIVTDAAGAPLYDAEVEIYGDVEDEPFDKVSTDFLGKFTIETLAPGSYRVRFSHDDHVPQWYGGRDRRSAVPVVIAEARTPVVNAALAKGGGKVSGKLSSPAGDDIGQAWLTVIDAASGEAVADERICECSGKFGTTVPTGLYQLRVERHNEVTWYGGATRKSATPLTVKGELTNLNMIIKE